MPLQSEDLVHEEIKEKLEKAGWLCERFLKKITG